VVLQENVLFNRSVRENIALADPALPLNRVVEAAQLSGAHEFILKLPHGYDTLIEERGARFPRPRRPLRRCAAGPSSANRRFCKGRPRNWRTPRSGSPRRVRS
jgi:hypothetical protein